MTELKWALRAREDLLEIADYYDAIEPGLGETMLERIETAPLLLIDHPYAGAPMPNTTFRKWSAKDTAFVLLYRVRKDSVEVARVIHSATNWRPQ